MTLTWKNGTEKPTRVRVLRNGVEIAAAAPAEAATFVDASAPLGVAQYYLQFTMPTSPCPPRTLSHNTGISSLKAHLRVKGVRLSWKNNLAYTGIKVTRNGAVLAAALPGTATSYVDPAPAAGLVTYTVEPTTVGSTPAQVSLNVSAIPAQTAVIYEPFDMMQGARLDGQKGGLGLDGDWVGSGMLGVATGSLSFATLPTFGNSIVRAGGNGSCSVAIGSSLTEAGLLADGAELWFSFLHRNPNNINAQPAFILGSESVLSFNKISAAGSGIGVRITSGTKPTPATFNNGTYLEGPVQSTLGASEIALIVGKITWGATPSEPDTLQLYTPGTDLALDTPTSQSAVLNQATFNVLSLWGNVSCPEIDEIRFGASYSAVTGQGK